MPNLRELTLEFPLEVLSESGFPLVLLGKNRFLGFLRQDTYGFQISHKVPVAEVSAFKERIMEQNEAVRSVSKLSQADKDGIETLLLRGRWLRNGGGKERRGQAAKTLRALGACQAYLSRPSVVSGKKLRVAIRGERSKIGKLLARIDRLKVEYSIS
jgi:hypothetical protein